jgi:Cdc6-like AAA superfamily ATPase
LINIHKSPNFGRIYPISPDSFSKSLKNHKFSPKITKNHSKITQKSLKNHPKSPKNHKKSLKNHQKSLKNRPKSLKNPQITNKKQDELDLLVTRKQRVIYNLFDWPTRENAK